MKKVSEKRMAKLVEDVYKGKSTGSVDEWRAIAIHYRSVACAAELKLEKVLPASLALLTGHHLVNSALEALAKSARNPYSYKTR